MCKEWRDFLVHYLHICGLEWSSNLEIEFLPHFYLRKKVAEYFFVKLQIKNKSRYIFFNVSSSITFIGSTDEESDYELEYDTLSHGSDEAWFDVRELGAPGTEEGVEYSDFVDASCSGTSTSQGTLPLTETEAGSTENQEASNQNGHLPIDEMSQIDTSSTEISRDDVDDDEHYGLDDMERLMSEIGNMRDNLRLMPDFQRRDMAAKLAMRMATMFGATSDEEEVW